MEMFETPIVNAPLWRLCMGAAAYGSRVIAPKL